MRAEDPPPSATQGRRKVNEKYVMTGQAGSYLYMAPEVARCEPYNEKVCSSAA